MATSKIFGTIIRVYRRRPICRKRFPRRTMIPNIYALAVVGRYVNGILRHRISFKSVGRYGCVSTLLPFTKLEVMLSFIVRSSARLGNGIAECSGKRIILGLGTALWV